MGPKTKQRVADLVHSYIRVGSNTWPGIDNVLQNLFVVAARAALGFFLSSVFGVLLYLITVPIVESIWKIGYINFALMGVVTIGFGAGVGSFLGWLRRDFRPWLLLATLVLSLAASMIGGWGGLLNGEDDFKLGGLPGIPALTGIAIGATLGGNIFNMAVWLFTTLRNPRIR